MTNNALVIGGNGGIAQAIIKQLCANSEYQAVIVLSRSHPQDKSLFQQFSHVSWIVIDSLDEEAVDAQVKQWQSDGMTFSTIISTVGVLHAGSIKPEKRLEDISINSLMSYFQINTLVNAQWLKVAPKILNKQKAVFVVLSARVGSISDNQLGGWYGYRASKAALNMLMKTASVEYKRRMPNTVLVCYHPGTVDTDLSKPFQANVKPEKLFTPEFTASQLLSFLPALNNDPNIHYIDWQGQSIHW